ncbi:MAG: hypothetical protein ACRC6M_10500 [Microcystaceae cyanobacterium]
MTIINYQLIGDRSPQGFISYQDYPLALGDLPEQYFSLFFCFLI